MSIPFIKNHRKSKVCINIVKNSRMEDKRTGMQRFVTYIYAYEDGKKGGNTGYAKIETRGNMGRIEIHFMDAGVVHGIGRISFAVLKDGKFVLLPIGELSIERGSGTADFSFQTENVCKSSWKFDKIDGICITDANERRYLSFWHDLKTEVCNEDMFLPEKPEENRMSAEESAEKRKPAETVAEITPEIMEEAEEESLHTMELPVQNRFPVCDMTEVWEQMREKKEAALFGEDTEAVRIELKDLRELPKKYWYMGNNSFLLHGFFNYHHLVLGKLPNDRWFLGVPGVYQRQERVMASIFGFPGFLMTKKDAGLQAASCEEMKEHQPGIWYHLLEE